MKIGVALLYGLYNPTRINYKGYLDFISQKTMDEKLDKLILCGGFTDPKQPTISEASSVKNYINSINTDFDKFVLEESSINTNQNLEFAAKKIGKDDEIVVFCDLIRLAKVIWISMHFLQNENQQTIYKAMFQFVHNDPYNPFTYKNLKILTYDFPNRTKVETIGQSFAALLDVMALYNPEFDEMDIEQRKKDFGLV